MKILNATRGMLLATDAEMALTVAARTRGLIGRTGLPAGQGLWLEPCTSITTAQITFPIDVVFVSREGIVTGGRHHVRPGSTVTALTASYSAIELPAGTIRQTGTQVGDQIRWGLTQVRAHLNDLGGVFDPS